MESKRDFGSFQSSNVEELIHADSTQYKQPNLAVTFNASNYFNISPSHLKFGSNELKRNLFHLTDEFTFLNHGAFGLTFKPVLAYVNQWRQYAESQPLRFYDREVIPLLVDVIRQFAEKVFKCQPSELVLIENCTFGFNSIINSIKLRPGDKVYIYSTTWCL